MKDPKIKIGEDIKSHLSFNQTKKENFIPIIIIISVSLLIYSNTITHGYALDDQMVLCGNKFVTAGIDGLGQIMTRDAFDGYFGEEGGQVIAGGRYRPLSLMTFALEWEFFNQAPSISHVVNLFSYSLLCVFIYLFLLWLFPDNRLMGKSRYTFLLNLPFLATIFYALHPIHTEVVANIKGRDEILGFLFGLSTIIYFFQIYKGKILDYIILLILFLFALLSKENAITFLAVLLVVAYYKEVPIFSSQFLKPYSAIIFSTIIFLALRTMSNNSSLEAYSGEILNNPFVRANDFEKWGTILFSYLEYLKLLIFPWKLSHDYYYNQIPYRRLSDPFVLFVLIGLITMIYVVLKNWKSKNIIVFSISFFVITFSVVSNILFSIGSIMNERFVFVSSLGFSIITAQLLLKHIKNLSFLISLIIAIAGLYAYKTYTRNFAWKDNYTLFSTDFYNSPNSSKVATSYGGLLLEKSNDLVHKNKNLSKIYLDSSIKVLNHALNIYPENSQASLLYGNALYTKHQNPQLVIPIYKTCLNLRPNYFDALFNLGKLYYKMNHLDTAEYYLSSALKVKPNHEEIGKILSKIDARSGRIQEGFNQKESLSDLALEAIEGGNCQYAISLGQQALLKNLNDPKANFAIGICYCRFMNRLNEGIPYLERAVKLDKNNGHWLVDLAVAYGKSGQVKRAIPILEQVIKLRPNEAVGYQNLSTAYKLLGDTKKANYYLEIAKQKSQP